MFWLSSTCFVNWHVEERIKKTRVSQNMNPKNCDSCEESFEKFDECEACGRVLCETCVKEVEGQKQKCSCEHVCDDCTPELRHCEHCNANGCDTCWESDCFICKDLKDVQYACFECMPTCDNCSKSVCRSHCFTNENMFDQTQTDICLRCVKRGLEQLEQCNVGLTTPLSEEREHQKTKESSANKKRKPAEITQEEEEVK